MEKNWQICELEDHTKIFVEFTVSAVPEIWIFEKEDGRMWCYWPKANAVKKIKSLEQPKLNRDWTSYKCRILMNAEKFSTYEAALEAEKYCENHSTLSDKTENEETQQENVCDGTMNNNPKYLLSLGRTVLSLSHVVPDGLLVFFPSYDMLKKCQDSWQRNDILAQIHRVKTVYAELSSKDKFDEEIKRFYDTIKDRKSRGAVFLAVCRGKLSEGLDFANENGRAVIITGLPFPPAKDQRVILKKNIFSMESKNFNLNCIDDVFKNHNYVYEYFVVNLFAKM